MMPDVKEAEMILMTVRISAHLFPVPHLPLRLQCPQRLLFERHLHLLHLQLALHLHPLHLQGASEAPPNVARHKRDSA